jgi:hypothetical protein
MTVQNTRVDSPVPAGWGVRFTRRLGIRYRGLFGNYLIYYRVGGSSSNFKSFCTLRLVPDFRVFQFDVAANLSEYLAFHFTTVSPSVDRLLSVALL